MLQLSSCYVPSVIRIVRVFPSYDVMLTNSLPRSVVLIISSPSESNTSFSESSSRRGRFGDEYEVSSSESPSTQLSTPLIVVRVFFRFGLDLADAVGFTVSVGLVPFCCCLGASTFGGDLAGGFWLCRVSEHVSFSRLWAGLSWHPVMQSLNVQILVAPPPTANVQCRQPLEHNEQQDPFRIDLE